METISSKGGLFQLLPTNLEHPPIGDESTCFPKIVAYGFEELPFQEGL